jgi:hypothetical protein
VKNVRWGLESGAAGTGRAGNGIWVGCHGCCGAGLGGCSTNYGLGFPVYQLDHVNDLRHPLFVLWSRHLNFGEMYGYSVSIQIRFVCMNEVMIVLGDTERRSCLSPVRDHERRAVKGCPQPSIHRL